MPTNDERREIAARLRLSSPTYDHGDNPDWSSSLCAIVQASPNEIFNRLADLIEPEERTVNLTEAVNAICSEMCGDGWDWHNRAEAVVKTIAEMCGAKVINK